MVVGSQVASTGVVSFHCTNTSDPGGYWWPPTYSTWTPTIVSFNFLVFLIVAQFTIFPSFLGLANFYCRFVLGFSRITWPLSQVTKGGEKEKLFWSESQQKAFVELKHRLCCAPILTLPYLQQPFEIKTDASDYAIGVVLTQQRHPVAYHSETLSDTVQNYPTYDKEMYSIVQAC
jgi:hypothetical protein